MATEAIAAPEITIAAGALRTSLSSVIRDEPDATADALPGLMHGTREEKEQAEALASDANPARLEINADLPAPNPAR